MTVAKQAYISFKPLFVAGEKENVDLKSLVCVGGVMK